MAVVSIFVLGSALTACSSTGSGVRNGLPQAQTPQATNQLAPNPQGEVIGNGNVRVALLVPTTIPGGAAEIAKELRNGAAMAMSDFGQGRIQLVVKDTKGQAAEAQAAASQAISEGASLILGPLFAANVSAASGVTLPANVPVLAFSTDTTVARRGVYLFSYTPQSDTERVIRYAASLGRRSMVAFLPQNAEGNLREQILGRVARQNGIAVSIMRYDRTPEGIGTVIAAALSGAQQADSVYIPEGGPVPGLITSGLKDAGIDMSSKQVLGSGGWEKVNFNDPNLQGAIFPGRDLTRFNEFAARYQQQFGVAPGVQAALAYDSITLASELVRINGDRDPFSRRNFESRRGYVGTNGAFRIRSDGTTQRGLAIYRIQGGARQVIEPAVSDFSGRGT